MFYYMTTLHAFIGMQELIASPCSTELWKLIERPKFVLDRRLKKHCCTTHAFDLMQYKQPVVGYLVRFRILLNAEDFLGLVYRFYQWQHIGLNTKVVSEQRKKSSAYNHNAPTTHISIAKCLLPLKISFLLTFKAQTHNQIVRDSSTIPGLS